MLSRYASRTRAQVSTHQIKFLIFAPRRDLHYDGRNRLSKIFTPTQRAPTPNSSQEESSHDLLIRAGFLRQAYSGIFHLLPLGLRVQNKIETLLDKHMQSLSAAKVSLSSLTSEDLWQKSGRLDKGRTSELLQLTDRKGAKFLLSPTHEEEITNIVAHAVQSYKDLPLRLYQVTRKYRDEPRPRQGLLRGREFLMKDLYTFDVSDSEARGTYEEVRKAYVAFLTELGLPFLVARADSGNMGGSLSHEYHFCSELGEDTVLTCDECDLSMNEELYIGRFDPSTQSQRQQDAAITTTETKEQAIELMTEHFISKDRRKSCTIHYSPTHGKSNINAIKALFPEIDTSLSSSDALAAFPRDAKTSKQHTHYLDPRLPPSSLQHLNLPTTPSIPKLNNETILLTAPRQNDPCPSCSNGKLNLTQAVEIGHTFHLGTRYSLPLEALVLDSENKKVPVQMGCHGIGVSRLMGAVASLLRDERGLNWPRCIAPFEVLVLGAGKVDQADVIGIYDRLVGRESESSDGRGGLEAMIDDRDKPLGWKLHDADLVGYPFVVVVGKSWIEGGRVELQCRRLGLREEVEIDDLDTRIKTEAERL